MTKYVFPPRPENMISPSSINTFEGKNLVGQVKANGSCGVLVSDSASSQKLYNRHNTILTNVKIDRSELAALHSGNDGMILVGEYLNKNQKHVNCKEEFNHKFLLHDVLVYKGVHLLGQTYMQRQAILDDLFRANAVEFDPFLLQLSDNVYVMKNFMNGFQAVYEEASAVEVYEGLVLKLKTAKLKPGTREKNNQDWSLKIRKATKGYAY